MAAHACEGPHTFKEVKADNESSRDLGTFTIPRLREHLQTNNEALLYVYNRLTKAYKGEIDIPIPRLEGKRDRKQKRGELGKIADELDVMEALIKDLDGLTYRIEGIIK